MQHRPELGPGILLEQAAASALEDESANEPCLTAIHFAEQLVAFHGCCHDCHTLARKEHDEHVDRNGKGHSGLSIFDAFDPYPTQPNRYAFVDALGNKEFMKLSDYDRYCMEDAMEGVMEGNPRGLGPFNVCLHW